MSGLILFLFLLWGGFGHQTKCPNLLVETKPIYTEDSTLVVKRLDNSKHVKLRCDKYKCFNTTGTAVTIDAVSLNSIRAGEATDTDAVAFNRRVRECQAANGELITK